MSGICGLFNLDGKPVSESEIASMTAMLERRGPDGTGRRVDGHAGLGHTLLATTPEAEAETQPLADPESGCIITADSRLDNRDDLISSLSPGRDPASTGDAELILRSYLKWGEDCPQHLLGDFAFGIHDPRENRVFCARDHSGMRLFYYHHDPRRLLAFATSPKAILVLPQVPYAISRARIADFLVEQLEWIDYTSTFFEDVHRLPPGHTLSTDRNGLKIKEYWKPDPGPDPGSRSDKQWRDGFLELFTHAVESRLCRSPALTGSMLSGGMDSGSVVSIGKELFRTRNVGPLHTYSANVDADPDREDLAEIRAIEAATSMDGISPALIHPDLLRRDFEAMLADIEEPFDGQCMLLKAVYHAAANDGRRVVLDGAGGDVVLSEGSYIRRLLRRGRIVKAFREMALENRFWESDYFWGDAWRYVRSAFAPEFIKRRRRTKLGPQVDRAVHDSLISNEFAAQVRLGDRLARMQQLFGGQWISDFAAERSLSIRPNMTGGRERYARLAAASGVEASDPFLDKRVIDFCSRMPGHLRLKNGWPKAILRDVMKDRLPTEVLQARGKHHLGWVFNHAVSAAAIETGAISLEKLQTALGGYVDSRKLANAWDEARNEGSFDRIHTAYLLSIWLRENENRPVVTP